MKWRILAMKVMKKMKKRKREREKLVDELGRKVLLDSEKYLQLARPTIQACLFL